MRWASSASRPESDTWLRHSMFRASCCMARLTLHTAASWASRASTLPAAFIVHLASGAIAPGSKHREEYHPANKLLPCCRYLCNFRRFSKQTMGRLQREMIKYGVNDLRTSLHDGA